MSSLIVRSWSADALDCHFGIPLTSFRNVGRWTRAKGAVSNNWWPIDLFSVVNRDRANRRDFIVFNGFARSATDRRLLRTQFKMAYSMFGTPPHITHRLSQQWPHYEASASFASFERKDLTRDLTWASVKVIDVTFAESVMRIAIIIWSCLRRSPNVLLSSLQYFRISALI
jgi:hypothetical protein